MKKRDQMPTNGCENCGAGAGQSHAVLAGKLSRKNDRWICTTCQKISD